MADFRPTLAPIHEKSPFRFWCQKVLPTVYDDSLSYYELLTKVVYYLNENTTDLETVNDNVEALYNSYVELQDYVNAYFDENFPQLVADRLDEMVENGTFDVLMHSIIDPYFEEKSDEIDAKIGEQDDAIEDAIQRQDGAIEDAIQRQDDTIENTLEGQNTIINNLTSRLNNFVATHAGLNTEVTLWEAQTSADNWVIENTTKTLSEDPSNYTHIDVYLYHRGVTNIHRFSSADFVSSDGVRIRDVEIEPAPGDTPQLYPYYRGLELNIKPTSGSTTVFNLEQSDEAVWDGSFSINPTSEEGSAITTTWYIYKIVGIKDEQNDNEIIDARVGTDGTTYNSLGAAIRGQASEIINALYQNKRFLQCGFMNGSRTNQDSGEAIDTSIAYRICSVNKFRFTDNTTFVIANGFRVRRYWFDLEGTFVSFDGTWKTETVQFESQYQYYINIARVNENTSEDADISTFMQQVYTTTPETDLDMYVKCYGVNVTSANVEELCGGDANNLPSNTIYAVQAGAITDNVPSRPVQGYTLICLSNSASRSNPTGTVQIAIYSGGHIFYRNYWNSAWSEWHHLYNTNSTRILAFGDSICLGGRNSGKGFAGVLGIPYKNDAVDGGLLSAARDNAHWIENAIVAETDTDFDTVILEGGINDYIYDAPLGTLSAHPVRYGDAEYALLDTNTVLGALEHAFGLIIHKFTNSSKYFLITHKTRNYPWTKNFSGGFTQQELHDAIVQCCKLYNIMIIDVYDKSNVNTFFPEYYSPTPWTTDHSVGELYFVDNDQVHPLNFGYIHAYKPIILEALKLNQ